MYEVIVRGKFSAGHQLRDINGICENLHGHNWAIEVVVSAEKLNEIGILIDFSVVEKFTKEITHQLDHQLLNDLPLFQDINPSAENISHFIFNELQIKLTVHPIRVKKVTVWETDGLGASYSC